MKKVDSQFGHVIVAIAVLVLGFILLAGIVWKCYREFGQAAPFAYAAVMVVFVLPFGLFLCSRLRTNPSDESA